MNAEIAVPKAGPEPLPELSTYLFPFVRLFRRSESRQTLERYITGLLTDLPRKNCDTIAAAVAGTSTERLQHLLTDASWDPEELDELRVRHLVAVTPPGGILALDDTGLPKQGKASVGVARQYSGTLGKVGNCQVVVSAEYVADEPTTSRPRHWPVTSRLYLPQAWADDPVRRKQTGVPPSVVFRTKLELAIEAIDRALAWGVPFRFVTADAGYGDQPPFLAALDARGLEYVCAVEKTFGIRLPEEVDAAASAVASEPGSSGAHRFGRPKLPRPAPLYTVEALIGAQPETAWQTITWRTGTKGALTKQFLAVRAHRATGNPVAGKSERSTSHPRVSTGPEGWVLAERPLPGKSGDGDEVKYYFSNLSAETPMTRLVTIAHARWAIEQFYEDAKGECGFDDYQGRGWVGLHRHLAVVCLAYSFLTQLRTSDRTDTTDPADTGGIPPLRGLSDLSRHPSPGARLVNPGSRSLVDRH